jgi:hypothetical protein
MQPSPVQTSSYPEEKPSQAESSEGREPSIAPEVLQPQDALGVQDFLDQLLESSCLTSSAEDSCLSIKEWEGLERFVEGQAAERPVNCIESRPESGSTQEQGVSSSSQGASQ